MQGGILCLLQARQKKTTTSTEYTSLSYLLQTCLFVTQNLFICKHANFYILQSLLSVLLLQRMYLKR